MQNFNVKLPDWSKWSFRVPNPEDQRKIIERFKRSGLKSKSDFARAALLENKIEVVRVNSSYVDAVNKFVEIINQIHKIGVNYNQIAKNIHTYHSEAIAERLLQKVEQSHTDLWAALDRAIDLGNILKDGRENIDTEVTE